MKTKTKIEKQAKKKSNQELVKTIIVAKKNKKWHEVSAILSRPRRSSLSLNLSEIDEQGKEGETVLIPGKVLSEGEIEKKIKIVALKFSGRAREKLEKAKISFSDISEEIKKNPEAKGIKILKAKEKEK